MIPFLFCLMTGAWAQTPFFSDLENFRSQSLSLKTERQNLEATSDQLLSSELFWTPKLSVSAIQTETQLNKVKTDERDYLQADATLNLFRGGADWNVMQKSKASQKAQELAVLNEDLRVEIKASDLIFKSIYLFQIKRIQEELLRLKEESLKIVRDRYQQGKSPLQEVTKSEVDIVQQKNKARQSLLDVSENRSEISSFFVTEIQTKSWPFEEKIIPQLQASQKIPLIEQKYWLSQANEQAWKAEKGGHWPSLDLSLQYQKWPIKDQQFDQWVGLVQLTLPLWNQYETSAKVSTAYALYIGALNDFKDTEQRLKQRTSFLKEKIEIARTNLVEAKGNLEKSKALYQDVLRSFRLGRISTNDLFLEQNRLLDSETALALSELTFHQTLIETCTLAGVRSQICLH